MFKMMRRGRGLGLRRGVSEIMSVTLLILIAVAVGTTFYLAAKSVIDAQYNSIVRELNRINEEVSVEASVVDAYYNSTDGTIHIFIYVSNESGPVLIDHAYINHVLVPSSELVQGFGKRLPSGITELVIRHVLSPGTYQILLTGPNNLRFVTYVTA